MAKMKKLQKVALVGGTHGNEYSGIFLLEQWKKQPERIQRESFTTDLIFANPGAYDANRRFVDSDLNRQFLRASLDDDSLADYEQTRAKWLDQTIGPKGNAKTDFIIDLHNTTSNMGPSLILLQSDSFNVKMAAYLLQKMPDAVIVMEDDVPVSEHPYLCAIAEQGVIVEIGPQPQSVLRHDILEWMETMTGHLLDYVHHHNQQTLPELPDSIEVFSLTETIKLPEDENGKRLGMVHKHVEDNDFKAIQPGEPIIQLFDGGEITWDGDYVAYPHFINEAAYYDNNVALSMAVKRTIKVD